MWLHPWVHRISRAAAGIYYRMSTAGPSVPRRGPVLLIANHPNALLDPVLVAAAARRPVRFLAKAPLFAMPVLGALVRAPGAIPVSRQQDDKTATGRNADSLRDAPAALAAGAVPVIALGFVLREKDTFRSEALVVAGEPVRWDDLAGRGPDDVEAARDLTARLDAALRDVTVNLEHWADRPIVECAEA